MKIWHIEILSENMACGDLMEDMTCQDFFKSYGMWRYGMLRYDRSIVAPPLFFLYYILNKNKPAAQAAGADPS